MLYDRVMRFLNIRKIGLNPSIMHDLYYRTIKASWLHFFMTAGLAYLFLNFFFACLYYFTPAEIVNVKADSLWGYFLFSFQTSSTIGYGFFLPDSDWAHGIVILDAISGIFYVAIITGLAFSKFARPSAKILFSEKVVFTTFDGKPAIMFRLANGRDTHIVDAQIKISVLLPYRSQEGFEMRRFYNLNLLSDSNPVFSLSWTAIYVIQDDCPLAQLTFEDLFEKDVFFSISFTGIDDVLSQSVHANYSFRKESFVKAKMFKDILTAQEGSYTLDLTNFHEVVQ